MSGTERVPALHSVPQEIAIIVITTILKDTLIFGVMLSTTDGLIL
jgi:hypothetical protein